ncbi:MAG: sterol desaturase family protein [Caulobacteraceae bacterium]|nr:sterol desaturase family protein [Caulobacter sp.]
MTAVDHGFASEAERLSASPRLFDNALLDKLSRVHWSVPLWVYVPVIAALGAVSFQRLAPATAAAFVVLGYAIWTLIEYFGHRYLFHWEFPGAFGRRLHFLIHGVHHDHPNDPLRLVMPILLSGPIMLIAWAVATLLFGATLRWPTLTGFVVGYLAYDMVHYYTHHAAPTTKLGLTLRRLHLMHHFRDHDKGFGVSAPYWDVVFGTAERRRR